MNFRDDTCSIITVNYNSFSYTKNLISSLEMDHNQNNFLYIIDNFSSDESFKKILNLLKVNDNCKINLNDSKILCSYKINNIYLIRLCDNYGYASAVNVALKVISTKIKNSFYWIINNDIDIESNTLKLLKEKYVNNTIVSPAIYELNNRSKIQSLGCKINPYFLTTTNITSISHLNKVQVDYLSGVSLFFNDEVLSKVGFLSESYFMYYEDVDWSIRALNQGIGLMINLDAKIFHNSKKYINFNLKSRSIFNRIILSIKFYKFNILLVLLYSMVSFLFNLIKYPFIIKNVK